MILTIKLAISLLITGCFITGSNLLNAQGINTEYERFSVDNDNNMLVGIALSSDQNTVAISSVQSNPLIIYDWTKRKVVNQFMVGDWFAGSSLIYSSGGKYLVLQQLHYIDWAPNKDKKVNYQVIDASSGNVIKRFENIHAAALSTDEKYFITLTNGEVSFWDIESGKMDKSFTVNRSTNGLAISPDGKHIAVSHRPEADVL